MPYYCTVPRCTSMAGKVKNVSFHQFPRDEERAKLWNTILKRGKPYTKYSKVCSLHFKPEDYVLNNVGRNKGQWRTLRKEAIPSRNLPSDADVPNYKEDETSWSVSSQSSNPIESVMQQQMAQAIYMQTMLAMHAALRRDSSSSSQALTDIPNPLKSTRTASECDDSKDATSSEEIESSNRDYKADEDDEVDKNDEIDKGDKNCYFKISSSFKCIQCLKCFKDPDVLLLHQRTHNKNGDETKKSVEIDNCSNEKENFNSNCLKYEEKSQQELLNPILANLLRSDTNMNTDESEETDEGELTRVNQHIKAMFAFNVNSLFIKDSEAVMKCSDIDDHMNSTFTTNTDESKSDE